jgi:hypothetical protein
MESCSMGTAPNRQGYLILGECVLPVVPVPEPCPVEPRDPEFGMLRCRCIRSRSRFTSSAPVTLRPRDRVRRDVRVVCEL